MTNSMTNEYLYENLRTVSSFNDKTRLCIYEPTHRLFVVKEAERSAMSGYEAMRKLTSPHLARIVCIKDIGDRIDVVREYIQGETLADMIAKGKRIMPETALKIAADVCDGLSVMHRAGYVHRDITANNIIVSQDGVAKIIDFGIMRCFARNKCADTVILGTTGYAAPEQFGFSQSDAKTDIYAVGVLINVMLTGGFPNERKVSGSVGKIIGKCIEIDSRYRYASIDELKEAICGAKPIGFIRLVPGLRSKNPFVIAASAIGYLFAAIFTYAVFLDIKSGDIPRVVIGWLLILPTPFFCFNNFLGIWDRLPFSKGAPKRTQRTVYTLLGVMSIFIGLMVFGTIKK